MAYESNEPRLLRAPGALEGVTTTGWAIAEGLRKALKGNAHLDAPGVHAILERLEALRAPIPTQVAPFLSLFGPEGPLPVGLQWCLPDTGVALVLPPVEGITTYFDQAGVANVILVIDRRYIDLIEDPGSAWPWDTQEHADLIARLGLTCA